MDNELLTSEEKIKVREQIPEGERGDISLLVDHFLTAQLAKDEKRVEEARQEGRKEVVEWGNGECDCGQSMIMSRWHCPYCRQSKFKDWGLK